MAEAAGAATRRGRPAAITRLYGLGSIFGKSLRDSRLAIPIAALVIGSITMVTAWQVAAEFDTAELRRQLALQMELLPPLFQGLLGEPINVETLSGFVSWRTIGIMPLLVGMWSVAALSGTIAGEAGKGILELVLATPVSRTSLALQKLAAYAVGLGVALAGAAIMTWLSTVAFATLPGDEATLAAALGEFALVGAIALMFGTLAFATGPLLGRRLAMGIGGGALFAAYMVNGYADLVPGFDALRNLSPFYWTSGHRPLAGVEDWPAVGLVLACAAAFAGLGVVGFQRRDLNSMVALPARRLRAGLLARGSGWSLGGVFRRSLGERLPEALGWGLGVGAYGLVIALSAEEFARLLASLPQLGEIVQRFFPGVDFATAGGVLQMTMFTFASLLFGLAAAALVGGWAAEETDRRIEMVLAAPLTRLSWSLRSAGAVLVSLILMAVVVGLLTAVGVAIMGDPVGGPVSGALVLGLYGAALGGGGLVVAGLGWPRLAGVSVAGLAIGLYLLEFIGSALNLPADVLNLALLRHLGQPMAGIYNVPGMLLVAAVTVGGLLIGSLLFARRDLR